MSRTGVAENSRKIFEFKKLNSSQEKLPKK